MITLLWICLLLTVVGSTVVVCRRTSGRAVDTAIRAAAGLTTLGLAGIAAAISYDHLLQLASQNGQTAWRAGAFPLSVDGLELVCSLVILADRRAGRASGWLPWAALGAGAVASLFANIAVAPHNLIARTIAGWPALALIIGIKLLSGLLEHATPNRPSTLDTQPQPDAVTPPAAPPQPPTAEAPEQEQADDNVPGPQRLPRLPVDLLRRIPVNPDAYQRWRDAWAALRDGIDSKQVATQFGVSTRHLQFVQAAGKAAMLDDPLPPAHRLAALGTAPPPQPEAPAAPINGVPVTNTP